jgi:hypothetical protein
MLANLHVLYWISEPKTVPICACDLVPFTFVVRQLHEPFSKSGAERAATREKTSQVLAERSQVHFGKFWDQRLSSRAAEL